MTKSRSCVVRGMPQALLAMEPVSIYWTPLALRRRTQSRSSSCSVTVFVPVPAAGATTLQPQLEWPWDAADGSPSAPCRKPIHEDEARCRPAPRASWHDSDQSELSVQPAVSLQVNLTASCAILKAQSVSGSNGSVTAETTVSECAR